MSDLVSDTNVLELGWQLDGVHTPEEPRVDLPESLGDVDGVHPHVQSWNTSPVTIGIPDVQDVEVETDLVQVENVFEKLSDLLLSGNLPLPRGEVAGQPWKAEDGEPILLGPVDHPVTELGVRCDLDVVGHGQLLMPIFDEDKSVIMLSNDLLDMTDLRI